MAQQEDGLSRSVSDASSIRREESLPFHDSWCRGDRPEYPEKNDVKFEVENRHRQLVEHVEQLGCF